MKPATASAAVVFALIALVHLARVVRGWEAQVDGLAIPMWVSAVAVVAAAALAVLLWREARR